MNSLRLTLNFVAALIVLSVVTPACEAIAATNAPTAAVTLTNKVSGTNGVSTNANAELTIPVSVFDLAAKPTKDPFFPLSTRQPIPSPTKAVPAFSITEFTLKGLSGAARNRLALINNRTFAEGESDELSTASGKVKVECVEIKETSAVIRVGARRDTMEIFLRKAAQ